MAQEGGPNKDKPQAPGTRVTFVEPVFDHNINRNHNDNELRAISTSDRSLTCSSDYSVFSYQSVESSNTSSNSTGAATVCSPTESPFPPQTYIPAPPSAETGESISGQNVQIQRQANATTIITEKVETLSFENPRSLEREVSDTCQVGMTPARPSTLLQEETELAETNEHDASSEATKPELRDHWALLPEREEIAEAKAARQRPTCTTAQYLQSSRVAKDHPYPSSQEDMEKDKYLFPPRNGHEPVHPWQEESEVDSTELSFIGSPNSESEDMWRWREEDPVYQSILLTIATLLLNRYMDHLKRCKDMDEACKDGNEGRGNEQSRGSSRQCPQLPIRDNGIRKRKSPRDDAGPSGDDADCNLVKTAKRSRASAPHSRSLSCPYYKRWPDRFSEQNMSHDLRERKYRNCRTAWISPESNRLKQHLYR